MDKKNFNEMMKIFGKVYEKSLAPDVLKIYFGIFKEIPDNKTKFIIKECLKKCKYFPRPADIFECLGEKGSGDRPESEIVDLRKELDL